MNLVLNYTKKHGLNKAVDLPGDKSIAHRALIIPSIGEGNFKIKNFPFSEDCITTLNAMKNLGVSVNTYKDLLEVKSPGYKKFNKESLHIECNNSGTSARLLTGLIAASDIECTLKGDNSLSNRPMTRVIEPLRKMGAAIESNSGKLPLKINRINHELRGIEYEMPVASAQVKSSLLIAGMLSFGSTFISEKLSTRDHTENMMKYLGANIRVKEKGISIENSQIKPKDIDIPGDVSSAAFIIALGILGESTGISIKNVLLNERRTKYIDILKYMGANIEVEVLEKSCGENIGNITVKNSSLKGITIPREVIPNIIDEIPVISVIAAFSEGTTKIYGVEELRFKESNRIEGILKNLKCCGKECYYENDCITIKGSNNYINKDVVIESNYDHRIAMAFLPLGLRNKCKTVINHWECTNISFPDNLKYFGEFLDYEIRL